jgi:hypothetical protein
MNEEILINRIVNFFGALSIESRLDLLSKLSADLKLVELDPKNNRKEQLLDELFGAWSDIDENLSNHIIDSRTVSDKDISFDLEERL